MKNEMDLNCITISPFNFSLLCILNINVYACIQYLSFPSMIFLVAGLLLGNKKNLDLQYFNGYKRKNQKNCRVFTCICMFLIS